MKKIFVLIIAIFFAGISTSYAIYVTEDFQSYTPGNSLNLGNGGSGWATTWDEALGDFKCQTVDGSKMGQATTAGTLGRRTFSGYTNEDITFQLNLTSWPAPLDGVCGSVLFLSNAGYKGPYITFNSDTQSLIARGDYETETTNLLGEGVEAVAGTTYTINITDVKVGVNGTYSVQVSKPGIIYNLYQNVKFEFWALDVPILEKIYFSNDSTNANTVSIDNITVGAVPEPSTYALFGIGLLGLIGGWMRRSKRLKT
ncbi:MAG: PEP-CTERM sorting domain-containing protein [Candidatus Ancaeobacter aquaticus]|nr:PEP-CTERM sorting domain-containing protein [Candidatus Ancaeobacter aquaticus]